MKSPLILTALLFLLATACKKREYPADHVKTEKEGLFFNGYAGEEPLALVIGTDGYFCYSSYRQAYDSVYMFKGELRKFDCDPCPRSIRLELSDYRKRLPGAAVPVDSAFAPGTRGFMPGLSQSYNMRFSSYSNKQVVSQRWDLSDGTTSDQQELLAEFNQPGPQTVSLTLRTIEKCESRIVNKIFIDEETGVFACAASAGSIQNNFTTFIASLIGGKAPFEYAWSFGDGSGSTEAAPDHTYQWAGSYPVKLKVKDADGNSCETNFIHVTGSDKSSCGLNLVPHYEGSQSTALNKVRIQWTDASNVVFRSEIVSQSPASYFEIVNSEDYAPNARGESGRLLTVRFNVLVSDGTRQMWFKCENAGIVVAYK